MADKSKQPQVPAPPARQSKATKTPLLAYVLIILFPLLFFAAAEGVLRVLDLYSPADEADPFIGLLESHRVFLTDPARGVHYIDRYRAQSFNVQEFPVQKGKDTFRVFCLGGSAAFGYPFGAPVAFSRWMQDACSTLWPNRKIEVINAAGMSYGSYRERALIKELLEYEPDLIVLASGHNEFIEKEFYTQSAASRLTGVRAFLAHFRVYNLLKHVVLSVSRKKQQSEASYDEFGLHVSRRENIGWSAEERELVYAKYRENIDAIAQRCKAAKVPLLIMAPAPNLSDWRPEHSTLSPSLGEEAVADWSADYAQGMRAQAKGQLSEALAAYNAAREIDDRHAELAYHLGQCSEGLGDYAAARQHYTDALDRDEVPIRISSRQRQALREIAGVGRSARKPLTAAARDHKAEDGPLFADAWDCLDDVSPHGITGTELFWDYCHPNVAGHQRVAALACSVIVASGLLPAPALPADWRSDLPVAQWDLTKIGMSDPAAFDLVALPKGADGLWWLGNCADRQGDREAAGRWYRQSLAANPDHPGSLIGLAIERSRAGDQAEAIRLGQRSLAIYERMGMARLVTRVHSEMGVFYTREPDLAAAEREFREVLRRDPTYLAVHENLGKTLILEGKLDEAESVLKTGVREMPSERGLHKQLGRVYQQQGRAAEAITEFEAELRLAPGDFLSLDALGDLHQAAGEPDLAARMWEAAMRSRPDSEATAVKLARLYISRGSDDDARRVMRTLAAETTPGNEAREVMRRLRM